MDEVEEWWLAVTEHMPVEKRVELVGLLEPDCPDPVEGSADDG